MRTQSNPRPGASRPGVDNQKKTTTASVQRQRRGRQPVVTGQLAMDMLPTSFVSLYEPDGFRRWYWASFRCPFGCGVHLARAKSPEAVAGVRRTRCGRKAWLVVARVYGPGERVREVA